MFQYCMLFSLSVFSNPMAWSSNLGNVLSDRQIFNVLPQAGGKHHLEKTHFQQLLLTHNIINIFPVFKRRLAAHHSKPKFVRKLPYSTSFLYIVFRKLFDS